MWLEDAGGRKSGEITLSSVFPRTPVTALAMTARRRWRMMKAVAAEELAGSATDFRRSSQGRQHGGARFFFRNMKVTKVGSGCYF